MTDDEAIEEYRRMMQKDTHPENKGAELERHVMAILDRYKAHCEPDWAYVELNHLREIEKDAKAFNDIVDAIRKKLSEGV